MTHFDIFLRFLLLSFFGLLLTGCVSNSYWTWRHPAGLGDTELQQATNECSQLAQREVDRYNYYRPYYYYDDYYFNRHYYPYGHYRPYYRPHRYYDFYNYNADLSRYYRICMRAKGWQQIRVDLPAQKNMSISPQ